MSARRIQVDIRGRTLDICYVEPAGMPLEPRWWIDPFSEWSPILTAEEERTIAAACLHDLVERRLAWRAKLAQHRESRQSANTSKSDQECVL